MKQRKTTYPAKTFCVKPVAAAVAAALGTVSTGLYAVEPDEIIVSATRRDTTAQEVPINISVVSGELLEEYKIRSLREFTRWVPGLNTVDQGPRSGSIMNIRGITVDEIGDPFVIVGNGSGDSVSTYFGEIPVYIDMKLVDMDRVEVLRGPQGTLYGANSLAGAIRYMPKRPDTEAFDSEVYGNVFSMSESDDASYDVNGMINWPIIDDKLALRAVAAYENRAGFIDYDFLVKDPGQPGSNPEDPAALYSKEDANDWQRSNVRLSLLYNVSDKVSAMVSYNYQKDEAGGRSMNSRDSMAVRNIDIGDYTSAMRYEEPNERENSIFEIDIIADLGFAELTSATGYTTYEEEGQRDQTDFLLYNYGDYGYYNFPEFTAFVKDFEDTDRFTQELRLVSPNDGSRFNWIAGMFYRHIKTDSGSVETSPGFADYYYGPGAFPTGDVNLISSGSLDFKETAIFGEIGYQLTDRWLATIGGRYFKYRDEIIDSTVYYPFIDYLSGPYSGSIRDDDSIFKFNTAFNFTEDQLGYFTISEGFRDGGVNAVPNLTDDEKRFKPDTTTNYELGYKSAWNDGTVIFNAALFYIDWEDIQVFDQSESGDFSILTNGNAAESRGIEIDGRWLITDKWTLRGGYSYTKANLAEDAPQLANTEAAKDDRLPGSPEQQLSLGIAFNTPLSNGWEIGFDYGITAQSDVLTRLGVGDGCCREEDSTDPDFYGTGEALPGFALHFASISLSGERWTASLWGENLANKAALTGARDTRDQIGTTATDPNWVAPAEDFTYRRYFHNVVEPRTIGLDLRVRFN